MGKFTKLVNETVAAITELAEAEGPTLAEKPWRLTLACPEQAREIRVHLTDVEAVEIHAAILDLINARFGFTPTAHKDEFVHISDWEEGDTTPLCWHEYAGHESPCVAAGDRWGSL